MVELLVVKMVVALADMMVEQLADRSVVVMVYMWAA